MHMQKKIWGQKHRAPPDATELHPLSGVGRGPAQPPSPAAAAWPCGSTLPTPAGPWQRCPTPAKSSRAGVLAAPNSVPRRSCLHAESHAKAKQRWPSALHSCTPTGPWPWLQHGIRLWTCGYVLFFWGDYVVSVHCNNVPLWPLKLPELPDVLAPGNPPWPWGYHDKKATWPSVNAFNSPHTLCVQQLLVSSSIQQHTQSFCPAKTFPPMRRPFSPPLFPSVYTNKRK